MFKKILATLLALFAAAAFAAVDVNKATQAELESIKGIGPAISGKILDERKKAPFKDWGDMVERVKGVGETNAAKFSSEGMTVNGSAFSGAPAKPAAAAASKPEKATKASAAAKTAAPAAAAMPASAAAPAAAAKPMAADDKKAAAMKDKEDKKAAAAQAKADKKAAKAAAKASAPADAKK